MYNLKEYNKIQQKEIFIYPYFLKMLTPKLKLKNIITEQHNNIQREIKS